MPPLDDDDDDETTPDETPDDTGADDRAGERQGDLSLDDLWVETDDGDFAPGREHVHDLLEAEDDD